MNSRDPSSPSEAADISITDLFEIEELQRLQDAFAEATGVASLITHPDGTPVTQPSNFCRLCRDIIRETEQGLTNCSRSGAMIGRQDSAGPTVQPCLSGGLWDAGASITVPGKHIANWLVGPVRNEEIDEERVIRNAGEIGADMDRFREALREVPVMALKQFQKIARLVFLLSNELSQKAFQNLQQARVSADRERAEEAERRSEAELRSFVENSPFGIFRSSIEEDRFLSVNPALVKLLGYARAEEILSSRVSTDVFLDTQDHERALARLLREGSLTGMEVQWRRNDGKTITANISGRLVHESPHAGRVVEGIVEDVTDRKRAEQALRESEERFRLVVESAPIGICIQTDDIFRYLNPAALDIFGAKRADQIVGRSILEMVHPGAAVAERIRSLREEQKCESLTEPQLLRLDGTAFDAETTSKPFTFEGRDGTIAFFSDITERKREQQALRESEERFRLVVEGAPMGIVIQVDGINRYLNPAALAMFGAETTEQIVGHAVFERIHPNSRAAVKERIRILRKEQRAVPFLEEQYLRVDGTVFDVEVSAIRFVFEGHEGSIVFVRDITERKREEAERHALEQQYLQAQKLEAIGRLAGGVAHDFNNLLMVIQSYTEMLQDSLPMRDSSRRNTEQVLKAAGRAASLTRQLLAFSRKQILSPAVLDLNAEINETTKMLRRLIGEDIEFRVNLAESLWAIEADPDQIVQVLMNLCVNARDAMPQGGTLIIATGNVTVEQGGIAGRPYVLPGNYVSLSVTDTGIGISREEQTQIFEPFFTTKEVGKGTGLGLAMVYGFAKQSGGYVWVDSEPGHGACFTICLPRVRAAVEPLGSAKNDARPRGTETLLVAEDEDALREAMCDYLRSLGYTVLAASSGQQALTLGQNEEQIHLLITDLVMPKMGGRDLSRLMGSLRPALKTIYISGYTDDAVLRHGILEVGATFLQKPFSLGTLARKVREALGQTELA